MKSSRRQFLRRPLDGFLESIAGNESAIRFGLVTYLWGRDWEIPTLIRNCQDTGVEGVELRTGHAHGVEVQLPAAERRTVKMQFMDSGVVPVGLGTNWAFHYADPAQLAHAISQAKASIILSHDIGASGVKVKPDGLPEQVSEEQTISQIGRALRTLGEFGQGYGQQIRLEIHGQRTEQIPVIKQIMDASNHRNVRVCWNCNAADLDEPGFTANFELVREYFGQTVHVRELDQGSYPYRQLFELLIESEYAGWVLLEARTEPKDRISALDHQRSLFHALMELIRKS